MLKFASNGRMAELPWPHGKNQRIDSWSLLLEVSLLLHNNVGEFWKKLNDEDVVKLVGH